MGRNSSTCESFLIGSNGRLHGRLLGEGRVEGLNVVSTFWRCFLNRGPGAALSLVDAVHLPREDDLLEDHPARVARRPKR